MPRATAKPGRKMIISKEDPQCKGKKYSERDEVEARMLSPSSASSEASSATEVAVGVLSLPSDGSCGKGESGMLISPACCSPINTSTVVNDNAQSDRFDTQNQDLAQTEFVGPEHTHSPKEAQFSDHTSTRHQIKLDPDQIETEFADMIVSMAKQCGRMKELSEGNARLVQSHRTTSEELARAVEGKDTSEQDLQISTAKLKQLQEAQIILSLKSEAQTAELEQARHELDHEHRMTWNLAGTISDLVTSKDQLSDLLKDIRNALEISQNEIGELTQDAIENMETIKQQELTISDFECTLEARDKELELASARAAFYRSVSLGGKILSRHKRLVARSMAMASDPKVKEIHLGKAKKLMREAERVQGLMYDFGLLRRDPAKKQEEAGRANVVSLSAQKRKRAAYDDSEDDDEESDWQ
ncbi:MAG: hypothetical protein Q9165_003624 [Trypethelium subeluteriae]